MLRERIKFLIVKNYNELLKQFLIALGTIWLLIEFVNFFKVGWISNGLAGFIGAITISLIWSIFKSFPQINLLKKSTLSNVEIEIQINRILNAPDCDISLPVNDCFDSKFPEIISESTVYAKLIKTEFNGSSDVLDKLVREYFDTKGIVGIKDEGKKFGKTLRYPFGTTAVVKSNGRIVYLTSMSRMTYEGFSRGSKESIWLGLCGLWDTVRRSGQLKPVALPIWGGGQSRTKSSKLGLIQLIILSFVIATNESKVSNKLIIAIRKEDYDPMMFRELNRFLNTISF